jgi:hypothetical protein
MKGCLVEPKDIKAWGLADQSLFSLGGLFHRYKYAFRNGFDCFTGCLGYQDVIQNVEEHQRKNGFLVTGDTERHDMEIALQDTG